MDELGSVAFFLTPVVVGFVPALLLTRRVGNLGTGLAVILFPVALALLGAFVKAVVWNPDAGCSEECWGVLIYGIWWIAASVGAEAGIIVAVVVKATRRRARDPRASSP
jgi:hypothetical protein